MALSQDEVSGLTHKKYGTKEALTKWFVEVDKVLTFPNYYREIGSTP